MFKTIKKMAVFSSLLMLSWSCVVDDYVYIPRSSSTLVYFGDRLVSNSSELSVSLLRDLSISEEDMNVDGFTYSYKERYSKDLTLNVVWVTDNCWEVTGTGEPTNFNLQVVRELSENLNDEYKWIVTSFSLNRDESNGYTAVMTTDGDVVFDWYESTTTSLSLSKRWELLQTGIYYLETYISGTEADSCILTYEEGDYSGNTSMVTTGSGFPN